MSNKNELTFEGVTPAGIARFPHLHEPDTKFDDIGYYKVDVVLSPEDSEELIQEIDELYEENLEAQAAALSKPRKKISPAKLKKGSRGYEEELDEETDEPTGNIIFKFKMKAGFKRNGKIVPMNPKIYDRYGHIVEDDIGGGSEIKVAYKAAGYYTAQSGAGVTLYLNAVQVLELRQWAGNAAGYGFEIEDAPEEPDSDGFDQFEDGEDSGEGDF